MIILDEHVPPSQRLLLRSWRIAVKHIGYDAEHQGLQDEDIIPYLQHQRRPTFATLDAGFYDRTLCHQRYCLVILNVRQAEIASFVRRLLRHPEFDTQAKRMGHVLRVSHVGVSGWRVRMQSEMHIEWV
jgi:hypothetical protein